MKLKGRTLIGAALAAVAALVALPTGAGAATFTNQTSISIGANSVASTYPSTINVAGLTGPITKVRASLFGVTGTGTTRLQVLLVGPGGQSVVLMRDTCGDAIDGVTFTFDDAAPGLLPAGSCAGQSGTYKPTDRDPTDNEFTAPAPPLPYGSVLAGFNGGDPNGLWRLFIEDDVIGGLDQHGIGGGWSLDVDVAPPAAPAPAAAKCKPGEKLKTIKKKGKKPRKKCVKKGKKKRKKK